MFSLQRKCKSKLLESLKKSLKSEKPQVLVLDAKAQDLVKQLLGDIVAELSFRRVVTISDNQPDNSKGAVYLVDPVSITNIIDEYQGNDTYLEAYVICTCPTTDEQFQKVKGSTLRKKFLRGWTELELQFNAIAPRFFTFEKYPTLQNLYGCSTVQELDPQLDRIVSQFTSFFRMIEQIPAIKFFDPTGTRTNLAGRLAQKLKSARQELEEAQAEWSSTHKECELIIVDRAIDLFSPLLHTLSFECACYDLLEIVDNVAKYLILDNRLDKTEQDGSVGKREIQLDHSENIYNQLRHLYFGEIQAKLQTLIEENPAAKAALGLNSDEAPSLDQLRKTLINAPEGLKIREFLHLWSELWTLYNELNLQPIVDLEQILATGEEALDDIKVQPISNDHLLKLKNLLNEEEIQRIEDKHRLQALASLRFPSEDFGEFEGQKGLKNILFSQTAGISSSDLMHRYSYQGWLEMSKAQMDPCDYLDRYTPVIERVISDIAVKIAHPCIVSMDVAENTETKVLDHKKRGPGSLATFKKDFKPTWGSNKPEYDNDEEHYLENGPRIIVFILGGATWSEERAIYKLGKKLKRDIIIGSTNLIIPEQFIFSLNELSLRSQILSLPPIELFDNINSTAEVVTKDQENSNLQNISVPQRMPNRPKSPVNQSPPKTEPEFAPPVPEKSSSPRKVPALPPRVSGPGVASANSANITNMAANMAALGLNYYKQAASVDNTDTSSKSIAGDSRPLQTSKMEGQVIEDIKVPVATAKVKESTPTSPSKVAKPQNSPSPSKQASINPPVPSVETELDNDLHADSVINASSVPSLPRGSVVRGSSDIGRSSYRQLPVEPKDTAIEKNSSKPLPVLSSTNTEQYNLHMKQANDSESVGSKNSDHSQQQSLPDRSTISQVNLKQRMEHSNDKKPAHAAYTQKPLEIRRQTPVALQSPEVVAKEAPNNPENETSEASKRSQKRSTGIFDATKLKEVIRMNTQENENTHANDADAKSCASSSSSAQKDALGSSATRTQPLTSQSKLNDQPGLNLTPGYSTNVTGAGPLNSSFNSNRYSTMNNGYPSTANVSEPQIFRPQYNSQPVRAPAPPVIQGYSSRPPDFILKQTANLKNQAAQQQQRQLYTNRTQQFAAQNPSNVPPNQTQQSFPQAISPNYGSGYSYGQQQYVDTSTNYQNNQFSQSNMANYNPGNAQNYPANQYSQFNSGNQYAENAQNYAPAQTFGNAPGYYPQARMPYAVYSNQGQQDQSMGPQTNIPPQSQYQTSAPQPQYSAQQRFSGGYPGNQKPQYPGNNSSSYHRK